MRCEMCPRTTMMTRPIETMQPELFKKIIDQTRALDAQEWTEWETL
jgi:hypothetical protein